jgi:hypothetical protein
MAKTELEEKRIFIVVSGDPRQIAFFQSIIARYFSNATVFGAKDGFDALGSWISTTRKSKTTGNRDNIEGFRIISYPFKK